MDIQDYKRAFLLYLDDKTSAEGVLKEPVNLYEPIHYILNLGGKRLRPILTLLSCDIFSGDYRNALDAALAIEMFHNFTLMHDDIMDEAPIRRGKTTVHKKWDINTGILSGDALMILAYQLFENYEGEIFKQIVSLFNKTAIEVCEGQQYDIDFEIKRDVSLLEYKNMIGFKTAVLVAAALKMGAIIANAEKKEASLIYDFGFNLGMAFQLQDDYLDTFGTKEFGKKIGGDILEDKKTFLVLKTLELASEEDKKNLEILFSINDKSDEKIKKVTNYFKKYKVDKSIQFEIEKYTLKAFADIEKLNVSQENKNILIEFGNNLMNRNL
ncbi:MAG: polyprenyl synthetase family protein [Bacteroidota bacterium]